MESIKKINPELKVVDIKGLASCLGWSYWSAWNLCHRQGFYPAFRVSKRIYVNVDQFEKWMQEQGEKGV